MREAKSTCAFARLLEIMAILRSPGGCPWDAEQTPESLKRFIVEEAYEVLEALDGDDAAAVRDELGDLLLQIVFQARIFEERGSFNMEDVATAIADKLVRRHPHVFGTCAVRETSLLAQQWEKIKEQENAAKRKGGSPLDTIPASLPALLRARKVIEKSRRSPPGEEDTEALFGLLMQYRQSIAEGTAEQSEKLLGDFLFALVGSATSAHVDAEESLRRAIARRLPCGPKEST